MSARHAMNGISNMQGQIVQLTCDHDLSASEVGYRLGIAEQTVRNYRSAVIRRFGARSMHKVCRDWGIWTEREHVEDVGRAVHELPGMRADRV